MRTRGTVIVVGLLAFGIVAAWFGRSSAQRVRAGDDVNTRGLEQLKSSVTDLQKEVALSRMLLASRPEPARGDEVRAGATAAAAEKPTTPVPPKKELTEVEVIAQFDAVFKQQDTDAAWSRSATSTGSRVLSGHLTPGSRLTSGECRRDLCRFETRHPRLEDYQQFLKDGLLSRDSGLWSAGAVSYVVEQGAAGVVAITFIAKEGQSMPEIPGAAE